MKTLIIYDSAYGNTEKIAKAIADALTGAVEVLRANEARSVDIKTFNLIIIGSPTYGGRPTPAIKQFVDNIPARTLEGIGVAAFDTRISGKDKGFGIKLLTGVLGYAAGRIAKELKNKGGKLAVPAEGFIVEGKEGPLKQGELERVASWAKNAFAQIISKPAETTSL